MVALILTGQIIFLVNAARSGAMMGAGTDVPRGGTFRHRVAAVLNNALGPNDRGVHRFQLKVVFPATGNRTLSAIEVQWAINNDLSAGTIGNAAEADVYLMLRDLYTSGLPIAAVQLTGTYPIRTAAGRTRETAVMRLAMSRSIAMTIARTGWDNLDAQEVWPLVERSYVNPQFQPLSPE